MVKAQFTMQEFDGLAILMQQPSDSTQRARCWRFSSAISASRVESGAFCLPGFNLATPSMGVHPGHEGRLGLYKSARMIFKTPHL